MNKQINALHVASLYLNEKRALNSSLWNSFFKVGSKIDPPTGKIPDSELVKVKKSGIFSEKGNVS